MKTYNVQLTMIFNGSVDITAENEEEALKLANDMISENYDSVPCDIKAGEVSFSLGEITTDYADESNVQLTMIFNGGVDITAENEEKALKMANDMISENYDSIPCDINVGEASFSLGEITTDYADEIKSPQILQQEYENKIRRFRI